MNILDRRDFIAKGLSVVSACAFGSEAVAQSGRRDSSRPIKASDVEEMARGQFEGTLTCVRTAEAPDGPFYIPSSIRRRTLAEQRGGLKVRLGITVANALVEGNNCAPLRGAIVDIWQADAEGQYSNIAADAQIRDTAGETFLRGHQSTDDNGYVEFDTILPGWYVGPFAPPLDIASRTSHIHLKVFHEYKIATAQLFFPDDFLDDIYTSLETYASHKWLTFRGRDYERIRNPQDGVFSLFSSKPVFVERESDGVFAAATIGIVTLGTNGVTAPPAFGDGPFRTCDTPHRLWHKAVAVDRHTASRRRRERSIS